LPLDYSSGNFENIPKELKFTIVQLRDHRQNALGVKPETVFQRFLWREPALDSKRCLLTAIGRSPHCVYLSGLKHYCHTRLSCYVHGAGACLGTKWEILDLKLPGDTLLTLPEVFTRRYWPEIDEGRFQQLRKLHENYFSRVDAERTELLA
jgi:hypothetical protein